MRFGYVLPNNWGLPDVAHVVGLAVEAEERGFDSVWVPSPVVLGDGRSRSGPHAHRAPADPTWCCRQRCWRRCRLLEGGGLGDELVALTEAQHDRAP